MSDLSLGHQAQALKAEFNVYGGGDQGLGFIGFRG